MANANPTLNPSADNDLPSTMVQVLRTFLMGVDDMLPVKVVSYDRANNRATVEHQILQVETNGDEIKRGTIISIPVLFLGGGGFSISFGLNTGDKGWIKASDRDLANFLESYDEQPPETKRIHAFENGIFIPDVMESLTTLAEEDLEAYLVSNDDGTQKISMSADRIKLKHNVLIVTEGPVKLGTGATQGIARVDDTTEMTFEVGTFGATASGIQIPAVQTIVSAGIITSGSTINKAE